MIIDRDIKLIGAGVVVIAALAFWMLRKGNAGNVGASLGGAAVDMVNGAATGVVKGVGGLVGLPDTNVEKGKAALANGDWLGASVYLPASAFIGAVAANAPAAVIDAANDPKNNPLQPVGSWIGATVYDWTHSKADGGVW